MLEVDRQRKLESAQRLHAGAKTTGERKAARNAIKRLRKHDSGADAILAATDAVDDLSEAFRAMS